MDLEKLNRKIVLSCPSCGNANLETVVGVDESSELFRCHSCHYEMTKDDLINGNSENISANVEEMKKEASAEIFKELKKQLQSSFKNSKYFKIK